MPLYALLIALPLLGLSLFTRLLLPQAILLPALLLGPLLFRLLLAAVLLDALFFTALLLSPLLLVPLEALHFPALLLRLLLLVLLDALHIATPLVGLSLLFLLLPTCLLLLALGLLPLMRLAFASRLLRALLFRLAAPGPLGIGPRFPGVFRLLSSRWLGLASGFFVVVLRIAGSGGSEKHKQDRCSDYPLSDVHGYCLHTLLDAGRKARVGRDSYASCLAPRLCFAVWVYTHGRGRGLLRP
ncbi:MAG: hypothetical protein ACRD2Q_00740 [Terriglobales bacterium]